MSSTYSKEFHESRVDVSGSSSRIFAAESAPATVKIAGKKKSLGGAPFRVAPPVRLGQTASQHCVLSRSGKGCTLQPKSRSASTGAIQTRETHMRNVNKAIDCLGNGQSDWKLMADLDVVDGMLHDEALRQQAAYQQHVFTTNLAVQVQAAKKAKDEQRLQSKQWAADVQANVDLYVDEEVEKRQRRLEMQARFEKSRALQLEEARNRRRQENEVKEAGKELAKQVHSESRQSTLDERREELRKKQGEATMIMQEAQASAKRKAHQREAQAKHDAVMMQAELNRLDKQAEERKQYYERIRAKQVQQGPVEGSTAQSVLARAQHEDEQRAMLHQIKLNEQEHKRNKQKQEQLTEMMGQVKDATQRQLHDKALVRLAEREESNKIAQIFRLDAAAAIKEERQAQQLKRHHAKENAIFLKAQMQQQSLQAPGKFGHDQMNDYEKVMNKEMIDRARDVEGMRRRMHYRFAQQ